MKNKECKAEKIRKCLKKGIPVASLGVGALTTAALLSASSVSGAEMSPEPSVCSKPFEEPADKKPVKKLILDSGDFNKDLSGFSKSGEEKFVKTLNSDNENDIPWHVVWNGGFIPETVKRLIAKAICMKLEPQIQSPPGIFYTPHRRNIELLYYSLKRYLKETEK